MRYEVSLFCEDLLVRAPAAGHARVLALHATLILDAGDEDAARSAALDALRSDPHLAAIAAEPPSVEIDAVTELPRGAAPHGPIYCFFQLPRGCR